MDYEVYNNRKEELIGKTKNVTAEMVTRIKSGEVIMDVTDDEGERTIVTLTSNGTYGYQVYERFGDEPHYYAEGFKLIEDLKKNTDSDGRALRYTSAKSRVQRNLTGVFSEYILDKGFHSFYINQKFEKDSEVQVSQRMAGYNNQDPVVLFGAQFDTNELSISADAQIIPNGNKQTVYIGLGKVKEDGTIDYDLQFNMAMQAERAKRAFGEESMDSARLAEVLKESSMTAQSLLFDVYNTLGLPIMEGVEPNDLLTSQAKYLLPEQTPGNKLD